MAKQLKSVNSLEMDSIRSLGIDKPSSLYRMHNETAAEYFDLSSLLNLHLIDLVQLLIVCPNHRKLLLQTHRHNGKYMPFITLKTSKLN